MAAETPVTISLQARDWENIIGVLANNTDIGIRRLLSSLQAAYSVVTPPQGATLVPIITKERVLIKIFSALHELLNYATYVGSNNFSRITVAIKAANVDGYITTETATIETQAAATRDARITFLRKEGRALLLIDITDNN